MELEHSFTVPVPEERAWDVLLDVERVAPCMPGASLDSVDGDEIKGRIKVKVGPIAMTYAGTARFTERDPQAHVIVLEASGKETRGAGTASATVRSVLEGQGAQTHVTVHTSLNVTGRPAQFGRGVMAEVGGKLIGIFASNLADMLSAEPASPAAPAAPASDEGSGQQDDQESAQDQSIESLNLSIRSYNSLRREGIHTVTDLAARTRENLLAIDGIGPASVEEIRQKLAGRGLTLSDSPASANGVAGAPASPAPAATGPVSTGTATSGPAGTGSATTTPASTTPASTAPAAAAAAGSTAAGSTAAGSTAAPARPQAATAATGSAAATAPRRPPAPANDDAINLLSVAGAPVLKRALPVAAALGAAAVIVLRIRIKRRRSRA
jgi:carbon monoxide dehydrogenase subunit G